MGCIGVGDANARRDANALVRCALAATSAPLDDAEAQAIYGKATPREALMEILTVENGSDPDAWELTHTLPMKFNRCVLFRPWFWHSSGDGFGTTIEDGRLVVLLFFAPAPDAVGAVTVPML